VDWVVDEALASSSTFFLAPRTGALFFITFAICMTKVPTVFAQPSQRQS
jgi:hypothetical protein